MNQTDIFLLLAVVASGMAAGAMIGHTLLLGSFLNWFFKTGNTDLFNRSYPVFLEANKSGVVFNHIFSLSMVSSTAFFLYLLLVGSLSVMPMSAIALQWAFLIVFYGSGLASLEHKLFRGKDAGPEVITKFLRLNLPVLATLSLLLFVSFTLFCCYRL